MMTKLDKTIRKKEEVSANKMREEKSQKRPGFLVFGDRGAFKFGILFFYKYLLRFPRDDDVY